MGDNKEALDALLAGIEYIVEQKVQNAPFARLKNGLVEAINSDGSYLVSIDDRKYNIKSIHSTVLNVGTIVQVLIAQNDYSNMFILN